MGRIRTIKPEFWAHPILSRESDETRLAAIGLLNCADDEGYFLASPALVRSSLWPFDECSTKARRVLDALTAAGWIEVCEHPTHGPIGRVVNFAKHQRIDRPSPSKIRGYFLDESSTNPRRILDEPSLLDQGSGNRDQGGEGSAPHPPLNLAHKIEGYDVAKVKAAICQRRPVSLLAAFGCAISVGGEAEWQRDAADLQIGVLAALLWLGVREGTPIRFPSDLRESRASWKELSEEDRRAFATDAMVDLGIHAKGAA